MKHKSIITILAIILLVLCLVFFVRLQKAPTGNITGKVIDKERGEPIEEVTIIVGDKTTTTDGKGEFTLKEINVGPVSITTSKEEYDIVTKTVLIEKRKTTTVEIELIKTKNFGLLSGIIIDKNSKKPISGVKVEAGKETTHTGIDGRYLFEKIDAGNIDVKVTMDKYKDCINFTTIEKNKPATLNFELEPLQNTQEILTKLEEKINLEAVTEELIIKTVKLPSSIKFLKEAALNIISSYILQLPSSYLKGSPSPNQKKSDIKTNSPKTFKEVQNEIAKLALEIDNILGLLEKIEKSQDFKTFKFEIPLNKFKVIAPELTAQIKSPKYNTYYIDSADILFLDTKLRVLKAIVYMVLSYDLELPEDYNLFIKEKIEYSDEEELRGIQLPSKFLTLIDAEKIEKVKTELVTATENITKFVELKGIKIFVEETLDHLIPFHPLKDFDISKISESEYLQKLQKSKQIYNEINKMLITKNYIISPQNCPFLEDFKPIKIDLTNFFNNPPKDLKAIIKNNKYYSNDGETWKFLFEYLGELSFEDLFNEVLDTTVFGIFPDGITSEVFLFFAL